MSLEDAIEVLEDDVSLLAKRMSDLVRAHNNRGKDINALKQSNDEILMVLGDLYKQREKNDPGEAIHHIITDLETLKREHAALDSAVGRRLQEGWASVQRQVEANTAQGAELRQTLAEQKQHTLTRLGELSDTVSTLTPRLAALSERVHELAERPDLQPRLDAMAAELRNLLAHSQNETMTTLRRELLATFQEELAAALHARVDSNPELVTQEQLKMLRAETVDHAQFHELVAPLVTVTHFDKVTAEMYRTFALREQCESRHREQEVADAEAMVETARSAAETAAVAAARDSATTVLAAVDAKLDAKLDALLQELLQTQLPGMCRDATAGLVTEAAHAQQLHALQEDTVERAREATQEIAQQAVHETLDGTLEDAVGRLLQQRIQPLLDAQYTTLNEQLTTLAHTIPLAHKLHETIGESVRAGVRAELEQTLHDTLREQWRKDLTEAQSTLTGQVDAARAALDERLDNVRRSLPNREVLALVQEECAMLRDSQHAFEERFDALANRLRDHFCQELAGPRSAAPVAIAAEPTPSPAPSTPVAEPTVTVAPSTPAAEPTVAAAPIEEAPTLVLECVALPSAGDAAPLVEVRMAFPTGEAVIPPEEATTAPPEEETAPLGPTTPELLALLQNLQSRVEQLEREKAAAPASLPDPLSTRVFPVGPSRIQYMKLGEFRFLLSPGLPLPEERVEFTLDGIEPPEEEMVATAGPGYTSTLDTAGRLIFQHKDSGSEKKSGGERVVRRFMFWW